MPMLGNKPFAPGQDSTSAVAVPEWAKSK